jgi:hypothetical protein
MNVLECFWTASLLPVARFTVTCDNVLDERRVIRHFVIVRELRSCQRPRFPLLKSVAIVEGRDGLARSFEMSRLNPFHLYVLPLESTSTSLERHFRTRRWTLLPLTLSRSSPTPPHATHIPLNVGACGASQVDDNTTVHITTTVEDKLRWNICHLVKYSRVTRNAYTV